MNTVLARIPSQRDRENVIKGLHASAFAEWKRLAKQELKSSSRDYSAGLSEEVDRTTSTITLSGTFPNMIEKGFAGGDMRQWMLKSPKAKQGKNGKYIVIPQKQADGSWKLARDIWNSDKPLASGAGEQ